MQKTTWTKSNRAGAASTAAAFLFFGCASTGEHVTAWGEITLAPGDTGTCSSNPCRVFFEMPPGEGTYVLRGTGFEIGEYPAGQTAMIGSFFESTAIKIEGADFAPTYLYVPSTANEVP